MNNNPPIPIPPLTNQSVIRGIVDSSFVIRTALLAGLEDIRQNPELINYVNARLIQDETTKPEIRFDIMRTCMDWILNQDIPIVLYPRLDDINFPTISINILDSTEGENGLGDVHYVSSETGDSSGGFQIGPFAPANYDVVTGVVTLPSSIAALYTTTKMGITTSAGTTIPIVQNNYGQTIYIPINTNPSLLRQITIKTLSPNAATKIESADFLEKFSIGCHAQGEPSYTLYLHALVLFILLRYRETLLERRGFERSQITNAPLTVMPKLREGVENAFSRYITLTGHTRVSWPKYTYPILVSTEFNITGSPVNDNTPKDQVTIWTSK